MNKLRYWFSSRKRQMAKLHDLQRQLTEAWEERDAWKGACASWRSAAETTYATNDSVNTQLHRVARERDKERELRLAAEELREHYLENEEE